jgi:hypothetical protein
LREIRHSGQQVYDENALNPCWWWIAEGYGHVRDGAAVGGYVVYPHAALVFPKHHVYHLVQAVLIRLVAAHDAATQRRGCDLRGEIEPCLMRDFSADFTAAFEHNHRPQPGRS